MHKKSLSPKSNESPKSQQVTVNNLVNRLFAKDTISTHLKKEPPIKYNAVPKKAFFKKVVAGGMLTRGGEIKQREPLRFDTSDDEVIIQTSSPK
jgi:hypothetical protein